MSCHGFAPVFDEKSRVLILGSFPSVMSRKEGFYYGNPRNRFWGTLASFFARPLPTTVSEKILFLRDTGVALWDMVASCEIEGSADASIREERTVDLSEIFDRAPICRILCNGSKAFELLCARCPERAPMAVKLPSTSPANPRFSAAAWEEALASVFGKKFAKETNKTIS